MRLKEMTVLVDENPGAERGAIDLYGSTQGLKGCFKYGAVPRT